MLRTIEAFADLLQDESPWKLPATDWEAIDTRPPVAPPICLGHDGGGLSERACSRITQVLLSRGCTIECIGAVSRPCLDEAGQALRCAAWLYVESGDSPAGIGIAVADPLRPWSRRGRLSEVDRRIIRGPGRASRTGGATRVFDAIPAYADRIAQLFQTFPPIEIGVMGIPATVRDVWSRIADRTAVRLNFIAGPVRHDHGEPTAASIRQLMDEIIRNRWSGGVVFGSNGQQLSVVDRQSGLVPTRDVCQWAASAFEQDAPGSRTRVVAFESSMWMDFSLSSAHLSFCADTTEQLIQEMRRSKARIGADGQGRLWVADSEIRCDALRTLAIVVRFWSTLPA